MSNDAELILDAQAELGEAPTWPVAEQALYWIDVKVPALHAPASVGCRGMALPADRLAASPPPGEEPGMQPALAIFDCDGVLVDSEALACRADADCLTEFGIPITAEEVMDRYVGINLAGMLADLEQRAGKPLPPDLADAMRRRTLALFDAELQAIAGVEAALAALEVPVCVASGSEPDRIRHSLTLAGLLHWFEPHVFSASQVARGKPAPDLFLFAAERMGADPAGCLVIEDSLPGVQAACAAGMRVLGFTGASHCRPGHADRLRAAGAALVFDDMRALPGLLAW